MARRKTDDYEHYNYDRRDNDDTESCSHCRGTGHVDGERCPACEGSGSEPGFDDEDD